MQDKFTLLGRRLTCLIFLVSCALPATDTCNSDGSIAEHIRGVEWLMMGWFGPFFFNFGWFANPLFLASIVRLHRYDMPVFVCSLAALVLAGLSFAPAKPFDFNEGGYGTPLHVCHLHVGFVVWLVALAAPAVLTFIRAGRSKNAQQLA